MNFKEWSEKYRVKSKEDGEELTAHGKYGYISEGRSGSFVCAILATPRNKLMNGALNRRKANAQAGGLRPLQVSPNFYESMWTFDGENPEHSELAIELIQPKRKAKRKPLTDDQKAILASRLALARANRQSAI